MKNNLKLVAGGIYKNNKGVDIVITYLDKFSVSYFQDDNGVQFDDELPRAEMLAELKGFKLAGNIDAV